MAKEPNPSPPKMRKPNLKPEIAPKEESPKKFMVLAVVEEMDMQMLVVLLRRMGIKNTVINADPLIGDFDGGV